jgi:hypothetical protein
MYICIDTCMHMYVSFLFQDFVILIYFQSLSFILNPLSPFYIMSTIWAPFLWLITVKSCYSFMYTHIWKRMYICTCIHTYIYIYIYVFTYENVHMYIYVCVYVCVYNWFMYKFHTCSYSCKHTYVLMFFCICIYIYIYTLIYMYLLNIGYNLKVVRLILKINVAYIYGMKICTNV